MDVTIAQWILSMLSFFKIIINWNDSGSLWVLTWVWHHEYDQIKPVTNLYNRKVVCMYIYDMIWYDDVEVCRYISKNGGFLSLLCKWEDLNPYMVIYYFNNNFGLLKLKRE